MLSRAGLVCAVLGVLASAPAASAQVAPHAPVAQQAPGPADEAPPAYPTSSVDRPVLLFDGMTTVDVSGEVEHLPDGALDLSDASAVTAHTRTTPGLALAHSFGRVRIGAYGTRDAAGASVAVQSSEVPWGYVELAAQDLAVGAGGGYDYKQSLSYFYKKLVTPHRFAFYMGFGANIAELKITLPTAVTTAGHIAAIAVNVAGEVQITERLSAALTARVDSVVDHSKELPSDQYLDAGVRIRVATHRFDLYGTFAFPDVTHTTALAASVGALCRFGM